MDCGELGEIGRIACEEVVQRLDSEQALHLGFIRSSSLRCEHTFWICQLDVRYLLPALLLVTPSSANVNCKRMYKSLPRSGAKQAWSGIKLRQNSWICVHSGSGVFVSDSRMDLPISHELISTIKVGCADLHDVQHADGVLAHVEDGQGVLGARQSACEDSVA